MPDHELNRLFFGIGAIELTAWFAAWVTSWSVVAVGLALFTTVGMLIVGMCVAKTEAPGLIRTFRAWRKLHHELSSIDVVAMPETALARDSRRPHSSPLSLPTKA